MTIEEVKQTISEQTGIPVNLLTGETIEDNIARAKALILYRQEKAQEQQPLGIRQQFAKCVNDAFGTDQGEAAASELQALTDLESSLLGVPKVQDGGSLTADQEPDQRTTAEKFADWVGKQLEYNPFNEGGWKPL